MEYYPLRLCMVIMTFHSELIPLVYKMMVMDRHHPQGYGFCGEYDTTLKPVAPPKSAFANRGDLDPQTRDYHQGLNCRPELFSSLSRRGI